MTPDHLRVKDCSALLKHLLARQKQHGVGPRVFSWKCFAQRQQGKGIVATPALISMNDDEEPDAAALLAHSQPRPPPRRKGSGKRKQAGKGGEDIFSDSGMQTPSDVDWIDLDGKNVNKSPQDAQDSDEESIQDLPVPPRPFNWMPPGQQRTNPGAEEEPEEANLSRRAAPLRPRPPRRRVISSEDEVGLSDVEEVPTPGERPVKPPRRRRAEVDQADVITAPRVRKESARVKEAARANQQAAPKPAVKATAAKRSKAPGKKTNT